MFVALATVAVSETVPPCCTLALDGVTETATAGLTTLILALPYPWPLFPLFSALVSELAEEAEEAEVVELDELASTRYVPGMDGAVYNPVLLTVPPSITVQVTVAPAGEVVVSWTVPPGSTEASVGETPRSATAGLAFEPWPRSAAPPHAHRRRTPNTTPCL